MMILAMINMMLMMMFDERDKNNAISKQVNFGLLMRGLSHDDHNDHDREL